MKCNCGQEHCCHTYLRIVIMEDVNESGVRYKFQRTTCCDCNIWLGDEFLWYE